MRTIIQKSAALLAALAVGFSTVSAATPFARYFDENPDFKIDEAFQYENSYAYLVRVCNVGGTPREPGTLRIAIGRSNVDREERNFSGLTPPSGSCTNVEVLNVRKFGLKSERSYKLSASVSWKGSRSELSLRNNSKAIDAMPGNPSGTSIDWSNGTSKSTTSSSNNPTTDLFLDGNSNNPYAGHKWYYPSGRYVSNNNRSSSCGSYWDGTVWRSNGNSGGYWENGIWRENACVDPYVSGTSGYYPDGNYSSSYNNYSTYDNGYNYNSDNGCNGCTYDNGYNSSYNGGYSTTYVGGNNYYGTNAPNFYVNRIERDGNYRNILAVVCNDGADMSSFQDVTVGFNNLSRNTSFRTTQYIKLLSGQCRNISVSFSSFAIDFNGYQTFEVTADPDNKFLERSESDNTSKANVWVEK